MVARTRTLHASGRQRLDAVATHARRKRYTRGIPIATTDGLDRVVLEGPSGGLSVTVQPELVVPRRGTVAVFGETRWTAESEAHIARHKITPDEVQEAIYTMPRYRDLQRGVELIYGTTAAGRHLFVVVSEAIDGRDMTDAEKRLFREKGH